MMETFSYDTISEICSYLEYVDVKRFLLCNKSCYAYAKTRYNIKKERGKFVRKRICALLKFLNLYMHGIKFEKKYRFPIQRRYYYNKQSLFLNKVKLSINNPIYDADENDYYELYDVHKNEFNLMLTRNPSWNHSHRPIIQRNNEILFYLDTSESGKHDKYHTNNRENIEMIIDNEELYDLILSGQIDEVTFNVIMNHEMFVDILERDFAELQPIINYPDHIRYYSNKLYIVDYYKTYHKFNISKQEHSEFFADTSEEMPSRQTQWNQIKHALDYIIPSTGNIVLKRFNVTIKFETPSQI